MGVFVSHGGPLPATIETFGNLSPLFFLYNPSCKVVTDLVYSHGRAA